MRLTAVILFLAIVQVSASSFGQKVTYSKNDITLAKLFKEIKKQIGLNVVWYEETLDANKVISAKFKDAPIEAVMSRALNGMQLTYTISKNTIVIKEKERSFLDKISDAIHSIVNDINVRGKIMDEYNKPLKGANVKIKGTNRSTITDEDGKFYFTNVKEKSVLIISYLGYKTMEVEAVENMGEIKLVENLNELVEVQINAGYYTVTDRERTGNISKVTSETIEKQPVNNPILALQGRVPGLVITQQTGLPGGGARVQIRGRSSINTQVGNDPLYIVDGVNYPSTKVATSSSQTMLGSAGASPLSYINPNDIESIEVLKDADATAIYGSRGANGVILIRTKKGVSGKTKINAVITQGFNQVGHKVKLLNTEEYLAMRMEAFKNDGLSPTSTDYDVNGTWDKTKYTDWQKELIGGTAHTTNASLNASGGTESINYLVGGNYYQEGTVFPGAFSFRRGGMHSSLTFGSIKDRFNATLTTSYNHTQSNLMANDITQYITLAPNSPNVYDQYGKINWENNTVYLNPLATLISTNKTNLDNLITNLTISYRFLDKLVFKTSLSYGAIKSDGIKKTPLSSFSPAYSLDATSRESYFSTVKNNNWTAEPQLSYEAELGPGNFNALIGMSFQGNTAQLRTIEGNNFSSDQLMDDISSAGALYPFENTSSQYRYVAAFTRLNYNLKNKYLLNLTARRDGSSRFGDGKKFANFGAIGAAWLFSEETFVKNYLPFLSLGKLRASYGSTGNDQISDYGYLQLWRSATGTYQGIPTISPNSSKIGNPDFAWETNRKAEIAMQLGFLDDRINLEFSYYRNRTSNQLIGEPLPPSTGSFSIQANRPATVQNSGLEIEANIKLLNGQNLKWLLGFNLTIPKNKLISYPGIETSSDAYNYLVGQPLTIRRIYNVKGVNRQTGLYDIEDKDGNGVINDKDRYLYKFTGQYFYGAVSNTIHFKQFTLDFLFSFTKQNGNNYTSSISFAPGGSYSDTPLGNQPTIVLGRWQKVNDQSTIQKFSTLDSPSILWAQANSLGGLSIVDASYIRLKNISFSYALPTRWVTAMKIRKAEINLQGQNIFTVTHYTGLDPETQSLAVLPPLRALTLGLNLIF